MCEPNVLEFARIILQRIPVTNASVLEVGSYDINGSVRPDVLAKNPSAYLGVDIQEGPGVDEICDVADLIKTYGASRYDIVITTEMMEHVYYWREAIHNLKGVLKPGGYLILTTRSIGKAYHGYPADFWRYELEDMEEIFSDCTILALEKDNSRGPGVMIAVQKPESYSEIVLDDVALYSILTRRRTTHVPTVTRNIITWWHGFRPRVAKFIEKLPGGQSLTRLYRNTKYGTNYEQ